MTVVTPQLPRYPAEFPVPQRTSYSGTIDSGLVRSPQQGFPQQYRFTPTAPTRLNMTFRVPRDLYVKWTRWVNTYAVTRWCLLPCIDQYQLIDPTPTYDWSIVRFVGNRMRTRLIGEEWLDISCEVDVWPVEVGVSKPGTNYPGIDDPVSPECIPYNCAALEEWLVASGINAAQYNFTSEFLVSGGTEQEVQDALRGVPVNTGAFEVGQTTYAGNSFLSTAPLPGPGDQCAPFNAQFPMVATQDAVIPDPWRLFPTDVYGGVYDLSIAYALIRRPGRDAWYLPNTDQFSFWQYLQRPYGTFANPTGTIIQSASSHIYYTSGNAGDDLFFTARAMGDPEQNLNNQTASFIDIPMGSMQMPLDALDDWCALSLTVNVNPFIAPKYERVPGDWWQTIGFNQEFIVSLAYKAPGGVVTQSLPPVTVTTYGTGTFQLNVPDGTENTRRYVEVGLADNPGQSPLIFWGSDGQVAAVYTDTSHIDPGGLLIALLRNQSRYELPPFCFA